MRMYFCFNQRLKALTGGFVFQVVCFCSFSMQTVFMSGIFVLSSSSLVPSSSHQSTSWRSGNVKVFSIKFLCDYRTETILHFIPFGLYACTVTRLTWPALFLSTIPNKIHPCSRFPGARGRCLIGTTFSPAQKYSRIIINQYLIV